MRRSADLGILGQDAPEWNVSIWFNQPNDSDLPVKIADITAPVIYLYCFQSWLAIPILGVVSCALAIFATATQVGALEVVLFLAMATISISTEVVSRRLNRSMCLQSSELASS